MKRHEVRLALQQSGEDIPAWPGNTAMPPLVSASSFEAFQPSLAGTSHSNPAPPRAPDLPLRECRSPNTGPRAQNNSNASTTLKSNAHGAAPASQATVLIAPLDPIGSRVPGSGGRPGSSLGTPAQHGAPSPRGGPGLYTQGTRSAGMGRAPHGSSGNRRRRHERTHVDPWPAVACTNGSVSVCPSSCPGHCDPRDS